MADREHADRCDSSGEARGVITYELRALEHEEFARLRQRRRDRLVQLARERQARTRGRTR